MALTFDDLDGKYEVSTELQTDDKFAPNGDGITEIIDGQTFRKDKHGMIWESRFTILNDTQVEMISTVDPSHSGSAVFISDEKGNPTKSILTYRSVLEATKDSEGKLVLTGMIQHGNQQARITMKKIR